MSDDDDIISAEELISELDKRHPGKMCVELPKRPILTFLWDQPATTSVPVVPQPTAPREQQDDQPILVAKGKRLH